MPHCNECGNHVTPRFAAVYGDNDDEVHACHNCEGRTAVNDGLAAIPDLER